MVSERKAVQAAAERKLGDGHRSGEKPTLAFDPLRLGIHASDIIVVAE
jgi:hypothetical protein